MAINRLKTFLITLLFLPSVVSAADIPDLSGFWTVRFEQERSGVELFEKLPGDAVFIDDAGGGELSEGDYGGLQFFTCRLLFPWRYIRAGT